MGDERLTADALRQLAEAPVHADCDCWLAGCAAWTSAGSHQWPDARLAPLGHLRDLEIGEPTFVEHHPEGTRIDSPRAPIALHHYPANRADAWRCGPCGRVVLHYQEAGGYYSEARVRLVDPALIVDVPLEGE
jgi:hypothetical protein